MIYANKKRSNKTSNRHDSDQTVQNQHSGKLGKGPRPSVWPRFWYFWKKCVFFVSKMAFLYEKWWKRKLGFSIKKIKSKICHFRFKMDDFEVSMAVDWAIFEKNWLIWLQFWSFPVILQKFVFFYWKKEIIWTVNSPFSCEIRII